MLKTVGLLALVILVGCGDSGVSGDSDASCSSCSDASPGDASDAAKDAPVVCSPLAGPGDAGTGPQSPLYPDPKYASVGANIASVASVCVDTSALSSHSKLDALVPGALAEAGLKAASGGGCACDWTLRFGPAPALSGTAQTTFQAGSKVPELYAEVTTSTADHRASTALYATTERGGLFALRAAIATTTKTTGGALVPTSTVVDYPDIERRGFLDGIYGALGTYPTQFASWPSKFTPGTRAEIVRLVSRLRGNTFIYGPKCDVYARGAQGKCPTSSSTPNWRNDYPTDNGEQSMIQTLATEADANLVDLYWAINPTNNFDWSNPDTSAIITKIDHVRALGVHHFAMFVDDSGGAGGTAAQDAVVMNQVNAHIKSVDPSDHLLVVTWAYAGYSIYNAPNSMKTFGSALAPDIEVMWSGPGIESCSISASDMSTPNSYYARTLSIWDNWPSYTCDPPYPGHPVPVAMSGRSSDLAKAIHAYYSNPVVNEAGGSLATEFGQLGAVFDYAWSPAHFDSTTSTSYSRWGKLLPTLEALVYPTTDCKNSGFEGFACAKPNDPTSHDILFCDQWNGNTQTTLRCPQGCKVQPGKQDTCL